MICDTTFLSDLQHERERGRRGAASEFLSAHRRHPFLVPVISAGELAVIFDSTDDARQFLRHYRILRLTPEVAYASARVDRELIRVGARLGENDTWIAGFALYYGQPLISRDAGFDRVPGLRRIGY